MPESRTEFQIATNGPLFAAWFSEWNANTYWRTKPFREQPCLCNAGSTGGAPVALGESFFVGLLRECDSWFEWDGSCLQVDAPSGALFVSNAPSEAERWNEYHQALGLRLRSAPFGFLPEYCTWMEQIYSCPTHCADDAMEALTPALVESYLETVKKAGWPNGRFTIDAGWSVVEGSGGFGDWQPRMDMPEQAEKIRQAGHIPGLWMAPVLVHPRSMIAQRHPEIVGRPVQMGGECLWSKFCYIVPSDVSQEMINDLFRRAFDWGFRKFKLDIFYGPKPVMREISRQCRIAADLLPEPVEVEGHIPNPFCAQYMDVIRLNDILISDRHPNWREVYEGHSYICRRSAPEMVLNLDHIGGNCVTVSEPEFIQHLELFLAETETGYPTISLLPQHLGVRAVEAVTSLLNRGNKTQHLTPVY